MELDALLSITKNVNDLSLIKNIIKVMDENKKSTGDIKKILHVLEECEYHDNALSVAVNSDILEKRSIEEQLQLMDKLKECEYHDNALSVAWNPDILEKISIKEQLQLMEQGREAEKEDKSDITFKEALDKIQTREQLEKILLALKDSNGNIDIHMNDTISKEKVKTKNRK